MTINQYCNKLREFDFSKRCEEAINICGDEIVSDVKSAWDESTNPSGQNFQSVTWLDEKMHRLYHYRHINLTGMTRRNLAVEKATILSHDAKWRKILDDFRKFSLSPVSYAQYPKENKIKVLVNQKLKDIYKWTIAR